MVGFYPNVILGIFGAKILVWWEKKDKKYQALYMKARVHV